MENGAHRFECVPEPSGTWMVWDNVKSAPASLGGCILRGRPKERARSACDVLKRIYKNRLESDQLDVGRDACTLQRIGAANPGRAPIRLGGRPYGRRAFSWTGRSA